MNIVFWADCYTEHQRQLSEELHKLATSFFFVADRENGEIDSLIGKKVTTEPDYVLHIDSKSDRAAAKKLISNADVIIAGRVSTSVIKEGIKQKKLLLRYSERPIKKTENRIDHCLRAIKWRLTQPKSKDIYLLAAGAYTTYDYNSYGLYEGKAYKWGYFPEYIEYEENRLFASKLHKTIVWAGRLIEWKHPEVCIELAKELSNDGIEFDMTIVGDGPLRTTLESACIEYGLQDHIAFTGIVSPAQVRKIMEQASIFICTSDRTEGWGAVVNEAMNSGCAVIANHMVGSVPFLIINNETGYSYQSFNELKDMTVNLLNNETECRRIGTNAYRLISEEWNAVTAAKRLVEISECLLQGQTVSYKSGPCSVAEAICSK